jgi:hypothetical protein
VKIGKNIGRIEREEQNVLREEKYNFSKGKRGDIFLISKIKNPAVVEY